MGPAARSGTWDDYFEALEGRSSPRRFNTSLLIERPAGAVGRQGSLYTFAARNGSTMAFPPPRRPAVSTVKPERTGGTVWRQPFLAVRPQTFSRYE